MGHCGPADVDDGPQKADEKEDKREEEKGPQGNMERKSHDRGHLLMEEGRGGGENENGIPTE